VVCVAFNSGQLRSLKKLLTRFVPDAELCMAMDRREAQSFVEAEGCDVLLTEIDLYGNGNTDGIRLALAVRERCSHANILFTTVSPAEEYADLILPLRISGLLQNPIQPEELAEEFRNLRYPL
jgi:DNA-binding NarL/FixJ family response regulator